MQKASSATVDCDPKTKGWHVHIKVGAEVIKRPLPKCVDDVTDDALRALAVNEANKEGYELQATGVSVVR